ncbi:hypothetical protein JavanS175_0011 [Streptococcus satellite phage Javan175]|uniref:hypothetical protein n=1 Tax=Streptococcus entericus TaxID=155680 RepID=UPI0003775081|nr:hypothetical protein [Streptococcus entericus]QBX07752.1 hypothetical protein JavanS175_0011 [Streptococcus satellite phage Javan175]
MTEKTKNELGPEILEINHIIGHQADFIDAVSSLLSHKETREAGQLIFGKSVDNLFNLLQDIDRRLTAVAEQLLED